MLTTAIRRLWVFNTTFNGYIFNVFDMDVMNMGDYPTLYFDTNINYRYNRVYILDVLLLVMYAIKTNN